MLWIRFYKEQHYHDHLFKLTKSQDDKMTDLYLFRKTRDKVVQHVKKTQQHRMRYTDTCTHTHLDVETQLILHQLSS